MPTGLDDVAVAGAVASLLESAVSIVSIIEEAFTFSRQCCRLATNCQVIRIILDRYQQLRQTNDRAIQELAQALTQCEQYLNECKRKKFVRNPVFEVTFHRRINKYKGLCDNWIMTATFSLQVTNLSISLRNENSANEFQRRWEDALDRLNELRVSQQGRTRETIQNVPKVHELNLTSAGRSEGRDKFLATLQSGEAVECFPLRVLYRDEAPRIILNYSRLSSSLHVQQFFGIFTDSTGDYAVMGDLTKLQRLQDALKDDRLLSASSKQKLRLCYEIANTVAFLHSVELVVKVISDSSIYIVYRDTEILPIFSDLESARSFLFPTDHYSYDQRYDPPEYSQANVHTTTSDIWSLGLILWQILEGISFPKNANPMTLREQFNSMNNGLLKKCIGKCFEVIPSLRPKASSVAQRLLDEHNDVCAKASLRTSSEQILALKSRCHEMVRQCRLKKDCGPALTSMETEFLLSYEDSWDGPEDLRLAPEISFLLGAAIFYKFVNFQDVEKHGKQTHYEVKSLQGYNIRYAITYLTDAFNMGYVDASYELANAHYELLNLYRSETSYQDIRQSLKEAQRA